MVVFNKQSFVAKQELLSLLPHNLDCPVAFALLARAKPDNPVAYLKNATGVTEDALRSHPGALELLVSAAQNRDGDAVSTPRQKAKTTPHQDAKARGS